jgi:hypothetical protein
MNRDDINSCHLRVRPICFKLKNSIYIASSLVHGEYSDVEYLDSKFCKDYTTYCKNHEEYKAHSTCDRYDIIEKKYYSTNYCYPFGKYPIHLCGSQRVVTNKQETLAVIIIRNLSGTQLMVFTEEAGFQFYFDLQLKHCGKFKEVQGQTNIDCENFENMRQCPSFQRSFLVRGGN